MDLKKGILQELEAIKEGFNDDEEMDGYDLANERFHLENAIALVKKLTITDVSNRRELLIAFAKFLRSELPLSLFDSVEQNVDRFDGNL